MAKKAKADAKLPIKKTISNPALPPDFAPLIQQASEAQALIEKCSDLNDVTQKKLDALIKGFIAPDNLSLIQLSVVPKQINTIQACWDSIQLKNSYATGGKQELISLLGKMMTNITIYAKK